MATEIAVESKAIRRDELERAQRLEAEEAAGALPARTGRYTLDEELNPLYEPAQGEIKARCSRIREIRDEQVGRRLVHRQLQRRMRRDLRGLERAVLAMFGVRSLENHQESGALASSLSASDAMGLSERA
ncbi:MAG TPA: hypothetical protein VM389_13150 [Phycisphaerae bacterium]|nr:hypothetical protein [Phycisphaerae bacterium]